MRHLLAVANDTVAGWKLVGHLPRRATSRDLRVTAVCEIGVSTFPGEARSRWLGKDVVTRIREGIGLPVEHVGVEPEPASARPGVGDG